MFLIHTKQGLTILTRSPSVILIIACVDHKIRRTGLVIVQRLADSPGLRMTRRFQVLTVTRLINLLVRRHIELSIIDTLILCVGVSAEDACCGARAGATFALAADQASVHERL